MKRIGNIVGVSLLFFTLILHAQEQIVLELTAKTAQGLPLQEVGINKPFIVAVTVHGHGVKQKVYIDTHNNFDLRSIGTATQMNSINGVATQETTYQYSTRAKEVGTFALGPAVVTINGEVYTSNALEVTVAQNPVERVALHEPKLELLVPKGPVVVGQMVPLSLRFYHLGTSQLSSISSEQIPGFADGLHEGPFKGTADIDGVPYDYVEWRTHIVAHKEGNFVFQPARAVYSMQARSRTNIWQQLSDRFSFGMQQYETFSQPVEITVDPLPPYNGKVDAVGSFTDMQALVNQTTAKQSEGIIYTLEITGDVAVKELKHPALTLPSTLTSYESKSSEPHMAPGSAVHRKNFEYVIQARSAGSVTIPASTFTFYDPNEQKYKQLTSQPIQLTIQEDANAPKTVDVHQHDLEEPVVESLATNTQPLALYSQGVAEFRADTGLSPALFWGILLLLALGLAFQWGRFFWHAYRVRNYEYLRSRAAFHKASKRLLIAQRERDARKLHTLFVDLFADRKGILSSQVLESDMVAWLSQANIPDQTVGQWQQYITQLQTIAYTNMVHVPPAEVYIQAEKWLALLEKTL